MNGQDAEQLTVVSFNCDGINNSAAVIIDFLDSEHTDIICIQETWLLDADLSKLARIHTGYLFSGKSGVDARVRILADRPSGGVAIAWRQTLSHNVRIIYIDNRLICAVRLQLKLCKHIIIIIMCVYAV